jgi:hypothetical protein
MTEYFLLVAAIPLDLELSSLRLAKAMKAVGKDAGMQGKARKSWRSGIAGFKYLIGELVPLIQSVTFNTGDVVLRIQGSCNDASGHLSECLPESQRDCPLAVRSLILIPLPLLQLFLRLIRYVSLEA